MFGEMRRHQLFGLLVAAIAFLVYANSLGNGFVWDDLGFVVNNSALNEPPLSFFTGYPFYRIDAAPYYRPLTALTFAIENRLHGLNPLMTHLFNVILHAGNALLVYLLAQSLLKNIHAALLAGLLFAVHPINTEAVNFISTRNDLIVVLSVVMAFMLHRNSAMNNTFLGAAAGAVFFSAGLFSKESALAVFPLIVAVEIIYLRTATGGDRHMILARLLPYAAGAVFYFVMRSIALPGVDVKMEISSNLGTRLLDNVYIVPRYFLSVFWPLSLSIRYYIPEDFHSLALPLAVSWICIIGVLCWLLSRGRTPVTLIGLLWAASFWLPVSGVVPIPSAPLADRYLYVPAIGIWVIAAERFPGLFSSEGKSRRYCLIAAGVLIIILSIFTVSRNRDWKNDVTLFSQYIGQNPDRAFGHHNLGCAYVDQVGDLNAAEKEFEKALALDPFFPRLRTQLGYIQLLRGDYAGAVQHYNEAVFQNPFDAEAFLNRAIASDRLGRYEDAGSDYKRFLAIPGNELAGARPQAEARLRELTK
jgi:tetratricopeptide (TPR) repeat protein